jgi:hypothetical protein
VLLDDIAACAGGGLPGHQPDLAELEAAAAEARRGHVALSEEWDAAGGLGGRCAHEPAAVGKVADGKPAENRREALRGFLSWMGEHAKAIDRRLRQVLTGGCVVVLLVLLCCGLGRRGLCAGLVCESSRTRFVCENSCVRDA